MISRESINKFFNSLAGFVSKLTSRKVQFHQIGEEPMGIACEKMDKFFADAALALDNPEVQMMGMLEPGKVYCLQIDTCSGEVIEMAIQIADELAKKNILVMLVDKSMNFVKIPEGYEVVKK